MLDSFLSLLTSPSVRTIIIVALVVGVSVSVSAALLGTTLVLKRYSMIGDGLSHVGYGALAVASAISISGKYTLEIALPIVILASVLLLKMGENKSINSDSATALISVVSLSVGTLILNLTGGTAGDACNSLFGSASLITITKKDMVLSLILSGVVIATYILFRRKIFIITFDEEWAKAGGINVSAFRLTIAMLASITIVLGMQLMGAVLITGLIILPTLSSLKISNTYFKLGVNAAIISVICFILGFVAALMFGLQMGPSVVLANFLVYLIISLVKFKKI